VSPSSPRTCRCAARHRRLADTPGSGAFAARANCRTDNGFGLRENSYLRRPWSRSVADHIVRAADGFALRQAGRGAMLAGPVRISYGRRCIAIGFGLDGLREYGAVAKRGDDQYRQEANAHDELHDRDPTFLPHLHTRSVLRRTQRSDIANRRLSAGCGYVLRTCRLQTSRCRRGFPVHGLSAAGSVWLGTDSFTLPEAAPAEPVHRKTARYGRALPLARVYEVLPLLCP